MIIEHKVVAHQPRIKRDKTGSIGFGTLLELTKEQFDELNDAYYNGTELYILIADGDSMRDISSHRQTSSEEFTTDIEVQ